MLKTIVVFLVASATVFAAPIGKIAFVRGKAKVFYAGKWQKARIGQVLPRNAKVQTSYRGSMMIKLNNGTTLRIKRNTLISLSQMGKRGHAMDLKQGSVSAYVHRIKKGKRNRFRVRTPTAVAGVRGTFIESSQRGLDFKNDTLAGEAFVAPFDEEGGYSYSDL